MSKVIMYLCSSLSVKAGHVFLCFHNKSDKEVQIGYYILEPGEFISIGSLGNRRYDGGGTYYNAELYMIKDARQWSKIVVTEYELSFEQLEKISKKIKYKNKYNVIFNNCGNFAVSIWNSVSKRKIIHFIFPFFTYVAMKIYGGKKFGFSHIPKGIKSCYKQVGNGLNEANSKSFNKPLL